MWRMIGWGGVVILLLIPLLAGFPWTLSDFVVMGVMFGAAGLAVELAARASGNRAYRLGALIAVVACFLLVWINLAVGIFGSEANPANLMFLGVIAVAVGGSAATRFTAGGMARAMLGAAAAQLLVSVIGYGAGWTSPGSMGVYEAALATGIFLPLWLIAAGLFARAAGARVSETAAR